MIKALLDKIGGLFEKDFLLGAFLPVLTFAAAIVATFGWVIGFEAMLTWAGQRQGIDKVLYATAGGVAVVVLAYIVTGIRPLIHRAWTGQIPLFIFTPITNLMKSFVRRRFLEARQSRFETNRWTEAKIDEWLADAAGRHWKDGTASPTDEELAVLRAKLSVLDSSWSVEEVKECIDRDFISALSTYRGDSLSELYRALRLTFQDWVDDESSRINTARHRFDRNYGSLQSLRANRLGNLVESYTTYSYSRYRIEPEAFWPHLQAHLGDKISGLLTDTRITFDFALSNATLFAIYAMLCLFGGPWLYPHSAWFVLAMAGLLIAVAAYVIAVGAAEEFGDLYRAAWDLHRTDLLQALHRAAPPSLALELKRWDELSKLATYGQPIDFELSTADPAVPAAGAPQ